ncbi:hypothetical protein G6F56_011314 [Rhizopus delemar]|nr:hypothetical protein G6F56_011314 [Rhizopus delemar]
MKLINILASTLIIASTVSAKWCINSDRYKDTFDYTNRLQELIDEASRSKKPVVYLDAGVYSINPHRPIQLREGVSIRVTSQNKAWSIQNLVFENVHVAVNSQQNEDEVAILGNLFLNGGRGSIISKNSERLHIDSNIFLRDELHKATEKYPSYNTTNAGVMFDTQKNSVVSNNIFGMDLRKMNELQPVVHGSLKKPFNNLKYIHNCLERDLAVEQGFLASGLQLYNSNDITIKQNILIQDVFLKITVLVSWAQTKPIFIKTLLLVGKLLILVVLFDSLQP